MYGGGCDGRSYSVIPPGLFRFLLAAVVIVSHFSKLNIGTTAVELFFVLSGFWIYRMFEGKYRLASCPGLLFIASRLLRLLPVFLLFNGLAVAMHVFLHDSFVAHQSLIAFVPDVLVIGYASLPDRPLGPAWSLDIEFQFYLLFPMIFAIINKFYRYDWPLTLTALVLGGGFMSIFLHEDARNVLPFIGFFLLGMLSARNAWRPSDRMVFASTMLAAVCLTGVVAIPALRGLVVATVNPSEFVWNTAMKFAFAVALTPLALSTVHGRSCRRDRLLGDMSYVVYCSHWLAVIVAAHYLSDVGWALKIPVLACLLAITYLVSLVVLIYVDRPISRWRERWIDRFVRSSRGGQQTPALP